VAPSGAEFRETAGMTPERWQKIDQLFAEALEQEPSRRAAFLARVCAGDQRLHREVASLLAAHEQSSSGIDAPGLDKAAELLLGAEAPQPFKGNDPRFAGAAPKTVIQSGGEVTQRGEPAVGASRVSLERGAALGRYVILEHLGGGGMGIVYTAYDPQLDRKVAIKLLRFHHSPAMDASEGRARLLREAQALGRLAHPNVISVFDVGTFEDQVFIAMEYVDGSTLTAWLTERDRSWREILSLFLQAGRGLAAAHEAGLVHRDFKPDNVLIGRDGRARVLDFGLARPALWPDEGETPAPTIISPVEPIWSEGSNDDPLHARITRPGFLVGTPTYMAPEQLIGGPADQRTDQFSFCTALYEALYRVLPFGEGVRPIPGRAEVQPAPKQSHVPNWLRRTILHGLRLDPNERHPSMGALLHELERDPAKRNRRAFAVAAAALMLTGGLWAYQRVRKQQDELCQGAQQQLAGIWGSERKAAVSAAFLSTGKPYATDAFNRMASILDRYAANWASMQTGACIATRVRGEQSEELMDLRMHCLAQRLAELRATTELLTRADESSVTQAVNTAQALTSLDGCADTPTLKAIIRPPSDPQARAKVDQLRQRLAPAKALLDAGKYAEGLARVIPMAQEAKALHYRPLEAEALFLLGALQFRAGDYRAGEQTLKEAVLAAEAGAHHELIAQAASMLVFVTYSLTKYEQSLEWGQRAAAVIERLGGNERLLAQLLPNLGVVYQRLSRFDEAFASHRRALEIDERLFGKDDYTVGRMLGVLGVAYGDTDQYQKAVDHYRQALSVLEKSVGPWHPQVGTTLNNLGLDLRLLGRREEAASAFKRALELRERALGPNHVEVAVTLTNFSTLLAEQGHWTQALAQFQRAQTIHENALGPEHPRLGWILAGLGNAYLALGMPEKAVAPLRRAVALMEGHPGTPTNLADGQFALARALRTTGKDPAEARIFALKAREAYAAGGQRFRSTLEEVDAWLRANEKRRARGY